MQTKAQDIYVSVVVPVYNEAECIPELLTRLVKTLEPLEKPFEIIAVDDGSSDQSLDLLLKFRETDNRLHVIQLARNFGQSPALYAGFAATRGQYVIMIDADLQCYPEDIPKLCEKLEEGFDMVSGWRTNRQDSIFRKIFSRYFNWYIGKITGLPIHDYGCALKAVRRELVDHLCALDHRCRYLPADLAMLGGRVAEIEVSHQKRAKGNSKYGFLKLLRAAFDMITSITDAPLRYIGYLGWLMAFLGFAMGGKVLFHRIHYGDLLQTESVITLFFLCTGVQLLAVGMMCEYLGRIYIEVQHRPYYIVRNHESGEVSTNANQTET